MHPSLRPLFGVVLAAGVSCATGATAVACADTPPGASSPSPEGGSQGDDAGSPDAALGFDSTMGGPTDAAALPDAAPPPDATSTDAPPLPDTGQVDGGPNRYDNDGPVPYTTMTIPVQNGLSSFTLNAYIPSVAGPHPVVSFSPGLQQVSAGYAPYARRLASYGVILLLRDDPGLFVISDTVAADVSYVVSTWLPAQNSASGGPLQGKVDLTRIGLAGHSRGGQSTLIAAEGLGSQVVSWFGIDPVDVALTGSIQASTNIGALAIPTTYLGAGVPTNCCPSNDNYSVLYPLTPSPSVLIVAENASHMQFVDPSACAPFCSLCTPTGTATSSVVLAYSVRYFTAFFARTLLGDSTVGAAFQGAGAPADVAAGLVQITSK